MLCDVKLCATRGEGIFVLGLEQMECIGVFFVRSLTLFCRLPLAQILSADFLLMQSFTFYWE